MTTVKIQAVLVIPHTIIDFTLLFLLHFKALDVNF